MRRSKTRWLILLAFVAVAVVGLSLRGQSQKGSAISDKRTRELPVVEFDAPEPKDSRILEKRQAKGYRYDRQSSQRIEETSNPFDRIWSNHWARGLSALPVNESDVVLIGGVLDAQAHLSNDRTGIYSEFNVQVEEVLKNTTGEDITLGKIVSLERFGGAVRFSSGVIQKYETTGQGMPRVGSRYLFFLKAVDQENDFSILTGYQIERTISPLDGSIVEASKATYPFDKYLGMESTTFLQQVRSALANNATTLPN